MNKPLYVGEYGPGNGAGWAKSDGAAGGLPFISAMGAHNISLSTMWAFECPSHDDMGGMCIHPGRVAAQPETFNTLLQLQGVNRVLAGGAFWPDRTLDLHLLSTPRPGANDDPACMDGTPYGYYMRVGARSDKWIVNIQGGGWCPDLYVMFKQQKEALDGTTPKYILEK